MAQFIVQTAFTANNQMSRPLANMASSLRSVNAEIESMAKNALLMAGAVAGLAVSGRAILDYGTSVASFQTIVSDLNDADFSVFKDKITAVALLTKRSTIDVAKSFEVIAGLNEKFAATATGLGNVSEAAITLAKASRMELAPAAESLVGIMNQFSFGTEQATRTINVLAAGQAIGAASITQTAEAMTVLGATAAGANVTLEQSVGLIQLLGKFSIYGADAGNKLKSALIKVQETGLGYASGQFKISDALSQLKKRYDALNSARSKDAFLTATFGLEQVTAGRIMLSNIDTFNEFTKGVTGTNEAIRAAAINTGTFSNHIDELKNRWVTYITTNNKVGFGMELLDKATVFVTNHMEGLMNIVIPLAGAFALYKGYLYASVIATKAMTAATAIYEFTVGLAAVATGALNGNLLVLPNYARGASAGMALMNTTAMGLLATLTRIAAVTVVVYGAMKIFDKKHIAEARMSAVLQNLPANVDKEKFSLQFQDILSPGKISLKDRAKGVKSWYPQETFDTLAKKYYDEPMRIQDSVTKSIMYSPIQTNQQIEKESVESYKRDSAASMGHAGLGGEMKLIIENNSGNQVRVASNTGGIPVVINQTGGSPFKTANA